MNVSGSAKRVPRKMESILTNNEDKEEPDFYFAEGTVDSKHWVPGTKHTDPKLQPTEIRSTVKLSGLAAECQSTADPEVIDNAVLARDYRAAVQQYSRQSRLEERAQAEALWESSSLYRFFEFGLGYHIINFGKAKPLAFGASFLAVILCVSAWFVR